jgi:hypothetical protein
VGDESGNAQVRRVRFVRRLNRALPDAGAGAVAARAGIATLILIREQLGHIPPS